MDHLTSEFRPSNRDRALRPVWGALAVLAAALTLGLLVVGPATLAPSADAIARAPVTTTAPTEVAIVPGTIDVVATRTPLARVETGHVVLTAYRTQ
ncbi:MAG: hypothetical protein IT522_11485 [Burkholderiales bacterium]|nr:hypothetical protein [Burkholderiales bacterium]